MARWHAFVYGNRLVWQLISGIAIVIVSIFLITTVFQHIS
jgi:hypothetical protein